MADEAHGLRPPLRIVSYNVHGCRGTDGVHDPERIGAVVAALDADLVGLQEVSSRTELDRGPSDLERVAQVAGLHVCPGPVRHKVTGPYGNALLSRWPAEAVRRVDLSVGRHEPRGALDVELVASRLKIRVIVTHLGLSPGERRLQARKLVAFVTAHDGWADLTVLLGDLNEWFTWGRSLRWLHRHFGHCPGVATFPSMVPALALDRIWAKPREALTGIARAWDARTRRASDHLPIVATVVWPRP